MSWFSSGVSIDERVEKATSENLPSGEQDLALNLEICDLIRSKTVQPKDAMRALKRRMLQKNPNVQILTLHLTDICIKNGGSHFLAEIASREFMDTLVIVLKSDPPVHGDVKELLLEYIQTWANAFEGQLQLSYVKKVYSDLKAQGFEFPSSNRLIGASFIDSSAPPEWVDSDTCMKSGIQFSFTNRKHHCRNCGGVYIQKHCNNYIALRHYGINEPVRVCDDCYAKLRPKEALRQPKQSPSVSAKLRVSNNSDLDSYRAREDADLQRALKLSLESTSRGPSYDNNRSYKPAHNNDDDEDEDEDEDMKAALAASLRDMEESKKPQSDTSGLYSHSSVPIKESSPATTAVASKLVSNDLSHVEIELISMYTYMVDQLQKQPPGAILRDTKLQQLNETVMLLRPKFANALKSSVDKSEAFQDMHGKLTAVTRYYDRLLESSLNFSSRQSQNYQGYYPPTSYAPPPTTGYAGGYAPPPPTQYQQHTGESMRESQPPLYSQHSGTMYPQHSGPQTSPSNPYYAPPSPVDNRQYTGSIEEQMTPSAPPLPTSDPTNYADANVPPVKKEEVNLIDL